MNRTIVIVALAAALLVLPLFTNPYWTDVCVSIGLYALLALSLNVILGQAGIFHMGHAAFFAVGAYSTAILNTMYHWPIFLTMPVAGCAAALFALVVARPIIHLRGDYLLIVTIGIVEIVRIALINDVGGLTGGSNGIFGISRPVFFGFRIFKPLHFYYLVWGMVGVSLLLFYGLWRSRIGRALNCIKEDDVAAEGCGINVTHYKLMAFVLGAFWAGMAGTLYAAKMTTIAPESFNFMESVIIFAVVILSGGSQLGVLVSAFLFIGLPELLREFSGARMLIFGLAMMLMMIWRPQGLMPPKSRRYGVAALLEAIKARACAAADGNAVRLADDARTAEKEVQLHEISKIFGGLIAINELSFSVEQGSVVGLIGPNGAGKTTVFNCITGNYKPEHGRITFGGQDITGKRPHNIVEMGIARTFQSIRLFGKLPALENVLAGRHCRLKSGFLSSMLHTPWQRREEKAAVERCMEELEFVGLADHYAEAASSLSYGNQRLLEIARALASDPRLLILDEPAGGMNDQETVALVDTIAAIRDRGITVLLIEHDMRLVMQICEHLVVLENGTLIAQGTPDHVRNHPAVIEAYLGSDDSETW